VAAQAANYQTARVEHAMVTLVTQANGVIYRLGKQEQRESRCLGARRADPLPLGGTVGCGLATWHRRAADLINLIAVVVLIGGLRFHYDGVPRATIFDA
jgi:hypothetical protein